MPWFTVNWPRRKIQSPSLIAFIKACWSCFVSCIAMRRGWTHTSAVFGQEIHASFSRWQILIVPSKKLGCVKRVPCVARLTQRRLDSRHVTILYQSDASLNMLMADSENLPKARVVTVIFGFWSFVFNELSWNPSQWLEVKIFFLQKSSCQRWVCPKCSFFFCVLRDHRTAFVSGVG